MTERDGLKPEPPIETILALSTGHMPNTNPGFGDFRLHEFEYGFVIWVLEPDPDDTTTADWFRPIMQSAWDRGCTLVLFDADCCVHEDLFPVYDW